MAEVELFQFELCPFCHKVKAGLELKGIAFDKIDVSPMSKEKLPPLPENAPKKVPVLRHGDKVIFDSTTILSYLDEQFGGEVRFLPRDEEERKKTEKVEAWVDDQFAKALPTVIYGTWGEALSASKVIARTSNFGFLHGLGVRAAGPLVMHQVAKRILSKNGKTDGHAWVAEGLDTFSKWLGKRPFVAGANPSLGDVAMHGVVTCVQDFPIFESIMKHSTLSEWFTRMQALRQNYAAAT